MRKKEIIELSITGVLVIVMVAAFANASKKVRSRKAKNIQSQAEVVQVTPLLSSADKTGGQSGNLYDFLEQKAKLFELKRDPFTAAPIVNEKALQSGVDLTGILWDKDKPLAIIDGDIVKKGTRIGDKTIVEIKKDRVILSDGQVFSEVRLQQ